MLVTRESPRRVGQDGGAVAGADVQDVHAVIDHHVPQHLNDQAGQGSGGGRHPGRPVGGVGVVGVQGADLGDQAAVAVGGFQPGGLVGGAVGQGEGVGAVAGTGTCPLPPARNEHVPGNSGDDRLPARGGVGNPLGELLCAGLPVHSTILGCLDGSQSFESAGVQVTQASRGGTESRMSRQRGPFSMSAKQLLVDVTGGEEAAQDAGVDSAIRADRGPAFATLPAQI